MTGETAMFCESVCYYSLGKSLCCTVPRYLAVRGGAVARGLEMRWECGGNAWFHVQASRNRRNRSENETVPVPLWHGE